MFTGIIQATGQITRREHRGGDGRFLIDAKTLDIDRVTVGDSVAVNGVCLTVTEKQNHSLWVDVSVETLSRTTFRALSAGARVNLEPSMTLSTLLGGHLVSGHVDATGRVVARAGDARSVRFHIQIPQNLARYIVEKGSICVDGVSLTVNGTREDVFDVNIIPHTLESTTLGDLAVDDDVNVEVDIVARYVEKLITGHVSSGDGADRG